MSGHCKCGVYHEEDDDRLCSRCQQDAELTRLRAELAEANRKLESIRKSGEHKAGEIFALREIASKVGTVGVTYHAITEEVLRWKAELAEARRHAKVLAEKIPHNYRAVLVAGTPIFDAMLYVKGLP